MRSLIFTVLLLFTAAITGGLVIWQLREGSLNRLLGSPPTLDGEKIYPDLAPETITSISVTTGEERAHFIKTVQGWVATSPWNDRMDPRAAIAILTFANTTTARDHIPRNELDSTLGGLGNSSTQIRLKNAEGETLAFFRLGRRTPLFDLTTGDDPTTIPTTYLLPLESGRKSHVYAATGDILPLFKNGVSYLRDHRPFFFNPLALEKIRLRTALGDLTLGRATPNSAWRIVKPLDLATDPTAMKTLLEGLINLQATKLTDRSEVTLPSSGTTADNSQIAISHFGSNEEIVLAILPPASADDRETQATISNRPETLFTLPLKAEPNLVAISDLPLTVNDLRDPTLTNLNIASVRGIAIETATTPTILISREPPAPWIATIGNTTMEANEQRLFDLLKAVTETRAIAFETDAAPEDLSPWGLDRPILTLTFLAKNNQTLAIAFGLDKSGNLFAKRKDSPSVMRLENRFLDSIAIRPHDWRHARLWSLSRVDLTSLSRTENIPDEAPSPLVLNYSDHSETWQASKDGENVTSNLDPPRASYLLGILENLQVARWLSPTDEAALSALEKPTLTFQITENTIDDFGDINGTSQKTLSLAVDPETKTVYGKTSTDPSPFTLPAETFLKLSIPLLDQ